MDLNSFGGRFKYSKVLQIIDNTDTSITSNITKIKIRRDLKALINQFAQYELCFGNKFHINSGGFNIKSTGFKISADPDTVYLTDVPNSDGKTGIISVVKPLSDGTTRINLKVCYLSRRYLCVLLFRFSSAFFQSAWRRPVDVEPCTCPRILLAFQSRRTCGWLFFAHALHLESCVR